MQQNQSKVKLLNLSMAYFLSRAIYAAAKLKIGDFLSNQPVHIDKLAAVANVDTTSLYRLLRMLCSYGIFSEISKEYFVQTSMGECLKSDHPDSITDILLAEDETRWNAVGHLDLAVRTGMPSFEQLYGMNYFDYIAQDSKKSAQFDAHMSQLTKEEDLQLLQALDLEGKTVIADIGGGRGSFLAQVLRKYPKAQGILYDLPIVVENEKDLLLKETKNRCELIPGSFFDSIPFQADAYLLKRVLHDWNDEECQKILANCKEVMTKTSKLYAIDTVIPEGNDRHMGKDIDVFLMTMFKGKERSLLEFTTLFTEQGMKIERIISTSTYLSILEVVKN